MAGFKRKRVEKLDGNTVPISNKRGRTDDITESKRAAAEKKAEAERQEEIDNPIGAHFVDNPKGRELKHEVGLYNKLASEDVDERLDAAGKVIEGLFGGEGVSGECLTRHLERRLFRGLASGRKGARLGYSVVLAEILSQLFGENEGETRYPWLSFEKMLDILKSKTKPEGDLSGQEEKDHALGLLFGLQSFVRAKVLFEDKGERWNAAFEELMRLCGKKPWLREEVGHVVVEALAQMNQEQAEETLEKILQAKLAATPEGVAIWITARRLFPDMKFPDKPWGSSGNPLEHLKTLGKALKESSSGETEVQARATGNWNPNLHFVWGIICDQYVRGAMAGDENVAEEFEKFWKVSVDENLFSVSASRERKFWGLLLFQKMLQDTPNYPELMTSIFSANLVRCLINHMSKEDRFLHRAAEKSIRTLQQVAEASPHTIPVILPKLISGSGFYNFDQITKTKTVEKMLGWANGRDAETVVEIIMKPAMWIEGDEVKDAESRRQGFADYLLSMIRKVNLADEKTDAGWIKSTALPTLAKLSYSKKGFKCKPELSEKSRNMFRTRLTSAFAHLISDPKGFSYPCELLQSVKADAVEMEGEVAEAKDKALAAMEKLLKKSKKAEPKEKVSLEALALLYALVVFQLLNGEADAASVLDELKMCYDKLIRGKEDEEGQDVSMILVEILLSLLSKPSLLLRKVAQHVFTAFSGEITAEGLSLMTDVLSASESTKGQQELFDQNDDEEEEHDHEHDSDDELDSDVEMVQLDNAPDDDDKSSDDDKEDDEEEVEEDENATALDAALAAALGTHRLDQDGTAEESDSDADMSDSEMLDLDAKLVEIFKQRKNTPNKKKEKKDARETVVNFKNRILDLLEIYVKKQAAKPEAFELILPLLDCMKTTGTKQVGEKAHGVLTAFSKAYKAATVENPGGEILTERLELLKALHELASTDVQGSNAFAKATSSASLLVASSMYKAEKKLVKKIAGVYRDSQVSWVMGEKRLNACLFHDWTNWCQSHAQAALVEARKEEKKE